MGTSYKGSCSSLVNRGCRRTGSEGRDSEVHHTPAHSPLRKGRSIVRKTPRSNARTSNFDTTQVSRRLHTAMRRTDELIRRYFQRLSLIAVSRTVPPRAHAVCAPKSSEYAFHWDLITRMHLCRPTGLEGTDSTGDLPLFLYRALSSGP